jgi:hypothetical protein
VPFPPFIELFAVNFHFLRTFAPTFLFTTRCILISSVVIPVHNFFCVFVLLYLFFSFYLVLSFFCLVSTIIHYIHTFHTALYFLSTRRSTVPIQLQWTPIDHSSKFCTSQIIQLYIFPICDSLHFIWSQPMHSEFSWVLKKFTVIHQD